MEQRARSGQIATALGAPPVVVGGAWVAPYPSGIVDRFIGWIDRLPMPTWSVYSGLLVALVVIVNATPWLDGSAPFGSFDLYRSSLPVYPVFTLGLLHHLNRVARRALATFRPVLGSSDAEHARLEFELTTLPWLGTWAALGASLVFTGAFSVFNAGLAAELRRSPWLAATDLVVYVLVFAVIGVFIYHTLRQLQTVSRIHADARNVNLFRLTPAYAFSGLTARTGIGLLLLNASRSSPTPRRS